jgi:hypothetical protein
VKKAILILLVLLISFSLFLGCMKVEEDDESADSSADGSLVNIPSGDNNSNTNANGNGTSTIPQPPALPE